MADKSQAQSVQKSSPEREKQGQKKSRDYSNLSSQPEWLSQAVETPSRARPEDVLALQRRFGNQVVQRVLDSTVQRQAVTNEQGDLRQDIAAEIKSASQGGQPLSAPLREGMSQQLGHDFSGVRIHTGRRADTLNRQLQARAFTTGNNIFFSQGAYDPQSSQGRHTLAHELTHVVQQSGGSGGGPLKLGKPNDTYEKEADCVAASGGESASRSALAAGASVVQRIGRAYVAPDIKWAPKPKPAVTPPARVATTSTPAATTLKPAVAPKPAIAPKPAATTPAPAVTSPARVVTPPAPAVTSPVPTVVPPVTAATPPARVVTPLAPAVTPPVPAVVPPVTAATPPARVVTPPAPALTPPVPAVTPPVTAATPPTRVVTPPAPALTPPAPAVTPPVTAATTPARVVAPPAPTVTPPASTVVPPVTAATPPARVVTPPAPAVTPPVTAATPPARVVTPPASAVTPPAPAVTPPVTAATPPARVVTPPAPAVTPPASTVVPPVPVAATPTPADPVPDGVSQAHWEIIKAEGVTKASWEGITPTKKAAIITALESKPAFARELIQGAKTNVWPQDGTDADITNLVILEAIKVDLGISWGIWNGLIKGRREVILSALSDTANARAKEIAKELATGAKSDKWPKAGTDTQDIQDYKIWDEIKKANNSMNIEQWNGLAAPSREDIIAAATPVEKRKFIDQALQNLQKQAHYRRDKENTRGEKVAGGLGKVFGHPLADAASGSLGLTSSIYGAKNDAKADQTAEDTASTVGKVGDVFDTVQQSATLLDSLATWRSGNRLDNVNSSRAARSLGRKKRSEGKWGASQSATGLGGSVSALVSDFGAEHDDPNAADFTSGGFGVAGGLLGSIKGFKGFFGSLRRSDRAGEIAKDATAAPDLKDIAAFTQKKQDRTGRGLGVLKGLASIGSGVAKFFGSNMAASITGGIGLASGIGSAVAKRAGKPDETELTQKAEKLADLLMTKNVKAIDFAINVLNIDIKSREPEEWRAWVLEDPEAAKELIKSKLSKQG